MEISTFHYRTSMIQCFFNRSFFMGPGDYWCNHGMWNINLVCFFQTKTVGIKNVPFWTLCLKIRPCALILNYPISFKPGSVPCRSALCLLSKNCYSSHRSRTSVERKGEEWLQHTALKLGIISRYTLDASWLPRRDTRRNSLKERKMVLFNFSFHLETKCTGKYVGMIEFLKY